MPDSANKTIPRFGNIDQGPALMGILNITTDSFYDGGAYPDPDSQLRQVEKMVSDGATIIDIGAVSTRPGAREICEMNELDRLVPALRVIRNHFPEVLISVDTFRPSVAKIAVEFGAGMINDIYGGRYDETMIGTVAELKVPYVIMHMKGTPGTMQHDPEYTDVVAEIKSFFDEQVRRCHELGLSGIILDPGFGFGKTVTHNYVILNRLHEFKGPGHLLMAGLSRKSMINKVLGTQPAGALNGTTVLNTIALMNGADILRVHDVKEASEAVRLVSRLKEAGNV